MLIYLFIITLLFLHIPTGFLSGCILRLSNLLPNHIGRPHKRLLCTLSDGFITYLSASDGSHPSQVTVSGGKAEYDSSLGRLIITQVTGNLIISTTTPTIDIYTSSHTCARIYNVSGELLCTTDDVPAALMQLRSGLYIVSQGTQTRKVMVP